MTEIIDKSVTLYDDKGKLGLDKIINHQDKVRDTTQSMVGMSSLDLANNVLKSKKINNYYDLFFIKIEDFRQILIQNNLLDYYKKITGETVSKITLKGILKFGQYLGYHRLSVKEIKDYIGEELKSKSITNINELIIYGLNNFKSSFGGDKIFIYFFIRAKKKGIVRIKFNDFELFGHDIGLKKLDDNELKESIIGIFKIYKINYLDDLLSIDVIDFKKIVGNNALLEYYFVYVKQKQKSFILKNDIKELGVELGLKNKLVNQKQEIKRFLLENGIRNFNDLKDYKQKDIRALLWSNDECRKMLNELGIEKLQDYRFNYLKKFARRIGLSLVPKDIDYNEEEIKKSLHETFKSIGVNCLYGLNFYGIKRFERLYTEKRSLFYKYINTFVKTKTGKILSTMNLIDFEKLGIELGLPEKLSEIEYKNKLLKFLSKKGLSLDSINKSFVKNNSDIWNNINFRYFMEKVGLKSDIKKLRPNHINDLKEYIGNVK